MIAALLLTATHPTTAMAEPDFLPHSEPVQFLTHSQDKSPEREARMKWFRDARFGMFIHWGLYSLAAGEWKGRTVPSASEWIIYTAQIQRKDYEPLIKDWNPVKFDATRWAKLAKAAGMKYLVITSKHHEGFCNWPTQTESWNVGQTSFGRDPLKELSAACKKEGIRFCLYYSIMDWHDPDYLPRRPWDRADESAANMPRYVDRLKKHLREILTAYDPGILWFDGQWESTWTWQLGKEIEAYCRTIRPNVIINNRVGNMNGAPAGAVLNGDYGTPEQEIPANGLPGQDWESCMTMNDSWGFKASDHNWKSARTLGQNLIDCASKGGNYLLNVGPTAIGEIPAESVDRLNLVGAWLKKYGKAVYGTSAGPFIRPMSWGRVTRKGNTLYVHYFGTSPGKVDLRGLVTPVGSVTTFEGEKVAVEAGQDGPSFVAQPDPGGIASIYVVKLKGEPKVEAIPIRPDARGEVKLSGDDAVIHGATLRMESSTKALGFWTTGTDYPEFTFDLPKAGRYSVELEFSCDGGSGGSEVQFGDGGPTWRVTETGSWTKFEKANVGTVSLAKGKNTLRVRALTKPGLAVMNLRQIILRPME